MKCLCGKESRGMNHCSAMLSLSEWLCVCRLSDTGAGVFLYMHELIRYFITDAVVLCSSRLLVFSVLTWCYYTLERSQPLCIIWSHCWGNCLPFWTALVFWCISLCVYKLLYSVPSAVKFWLCSTSMLAAWCKEERVRRGSLLQCSH